ncbi:MAG: hypothetical protein QOF66_6633, partial [Mycobacterium sp.]|uniref:hypothetical protein n=1 Tax=Mycobacterium sp. TaxID=1785 RepID=UPI0028BCF590|nr:hypothetical protein [Mycobacterium sp.]
MGIQPNPEPLRPRSRWAVGGRVLPQRVLVGQRLLSMVASRAAVAAEEGRSAFVDYVVDDFVGRTRIAVSDEVRDFILADVLEPEDTWAKGLHARANGLKANAFNPARTYLILAEALDAAGAERQFGGFVSGEAELDISSVGTRYEGA